MPQPKMPGINRSYLVWYSQLRRAPPRIRMNYLQHRQCNPKAIEVAFLSVPAIDFFAQDQLQALQDWNLALGQGLESIDATVKDDRGPLPTTFLLHDLWMFGCTKPTSQVTAVAQTFLCRYQLGLEIYNVQAAVEGMDGGKRSHLLYLCGQLLRLVLIPCHIKGEPTTGLEVQQSRSLRNSMDMS